jgi:3-oxoadipate enol-lactonase
MAGPSVPIDVHYQVDGRPGAPVVVLSHGLGMSMALWDPQIRRLSATFQVVRYDHRGHGQSPVPAGPYTIEDMGHDVIGLLDRLNVDRVSLCGLSLGGMMGIWLGANAPERIDRLVLCCTAARMMRPEDYATRAQQVREHGLASVADTVIGRWFTPAFVARHSETITWVRAMLLATPAEGYAAACEAIAAMDQRGELPRIAARTLVIAGAQDQATPPEQAYEIARAIPGAEAVVIPDAAHLANFEQAEPVTLQILRHLST